ncbi:hypothetical protein AVEN_156651-1 [Araneus ventricosus]|uniref:Uncharacterized protein n=1 Tax=Araneus ventricosus TaxID=182803 RepID=A0A4Y2KJG4_ARAVE|nr:hypothetical protein AVEN_156651-1 [Araneus ventricosus]
MDCPGIIRRSLSQSSNGVVHTEERRVLERSVSAINKQHLATSILWLPVILQKKYLNEGIVVRDCAYECKTGVHELSEFFCCQEDGCNTAPTPLRPAWTVLLTVVVHLALWGRYLT